MNNSIVKRIFYRIDFKLVTPYANSNQESFDITQFSHMFKPFISSHSIASAFGNFSTLPDKDVSNVIWFYDAFFSTYKINRKMIKNKPVVFIERNAKGSIYLQLIIKKKNALNLNKCIVYTNAKNAEMFLTTYLRNAFKAIKLGKITFGGFKNEKFGQLQILQVKQKTFDKTNLNKYLKFNRKDWKND